MVPRLSLNVTNITPKETKVFNKTVHYILKSNLNPATKSIIAQTNASSEFITIPHSQVIPNHQKTDDYVPGYGCGGGPTCACGGICGC
jgi:hypothetical protein